MKNLKELSKHLVDEFLTFTMAGKRFNFWKTMGGSI